MEAVHARQRQMKAMAEDAAKEYANPTLTLREKIRAHSRSRREKIRDGLWPTVGEVEGEVDVAKLRARLPEMVPPPTDGEVIERAREQAEMVQGWGSPSQVFQDTCRVFMVEHGFLSLVKIAQDRNSKQQYNALALLAAYAYGKPEGSLRIQATVNKVIVVRVDAVPMVELESGQRN